MCQGIWINIMLGNILSLPGKKPWTCEATPPAAAAASGLGHRKGLSLPIRWWELFKRRQALVGNASPFVSQECCLLWANSSCLQQLPVLCMLLFRHLDKQSIKLTPLPRPVTNVSSIICVEGHRASAGDKLCATCDVRASTTTCCRSGPRREWRQGRLNSQRSEPSLSVPFAQLHS